MYHKLLKVTQVMGVHKNSHGEAITIYGNTFHGITRCIVPVVKEGFLKGYLEQKKKVRGNDGVIRPW